MTQVLNTFDSAGDSRFYVSREEALRLLAKGCVMCSRSFDVIQTLWLLYETSDLSEAFRPPHQVAEAHLGVFTKPSFSGGDLGVRDETVFIVDQKAAVCFKCWVEFLRQVVALKGVEK